MVYTVSKYLLWPLFERLFVKETIGLENVPKKPSLFIINHNSYLDGPMIILLLAWYRNIKVYTFATNKKFTGIIWSFLFGHFGAIRIGGSMDVALSKMSKGHSLALFPEGQREYAEKVMPIHHSGAGVVALITECEVIPIGIDTYHFWNRFHLIPTFRKNIVINIGKPMRFKGKVTKKNALNVTKKIMKEVTKLAGISHQKTACELHS